MISGYRRIYLDLLPALSQCDLAESAGRLGFKALANGEVSARFCGREYLINSAGVHSADGQPINVNERAELNSCSVLIYYMLSSASGEPERVFVPVYLLTGTKIAGHRSPVQGSTDDPLLNEFSRDYDKFQAAALKLGGVSEGSLKDGGKSWIFEVLPKIPMRVVYYDADEDFPVDVKLFLDGGARRFLGAECLSVLSSCFTHALVEAAR
jgi:hypothetical protein